MQGLHCIVTGEGEIVIRLGKQDFNMPNYDGPDVGFVLRDFKFEVAVYELLRNNESIPCSALLYSRAPFQRPGSHTVKPTDILGRQIMVFKKAKGGTCSWRKGNLTDDGKVCYCNLCNHSGSFVS